MWCLLEGTMPIELKAHIFYEDELETKLESEPEPESSESSPEVPSQDQTVRIKKRKRRYVKVLMIYLSNLNVILQY